MPNKFVVRRKSGMAQKFIRNLVGMHSSGASDKEASHFDFQWEAELKIKESGLPADDCTVEPITVEDEQ